MCLGSHKVLSIGRSVYLILFIYLFNFILQNIKSSVYFKGSSQTCVLSKIFNKMILIGMQIENDNNNRYFGHFAGFKFE